MKIMNPKDLQPSVKFLIIYSIALLFSFGIPSLIQGSIILYINIAELNGAVNIPFTFGMGEIFELILMGPFYMVVYYLLMQYLLNKLDENEGRNKIYKKLLEIGVITLISIVVMGHAVHTLFNHVNGLYRLTYGGYDTSPLFSFIYAADEWLGHHLIHIGLFGFIILALITELLINDNERMKWEEITLSITIGGLGMFIVSGYATYEGQSATLMFILAIILLITEIIIIFKKELKMINYPILFATVTANIAIIGFFIFWGVAFGWKPYYPFIFQPSELGFQHFWKLSAQIIV